MKILSAVLVVFLLAQPYPSAADDALIHKVCGNLGDTASFCVTLLKSDPLSRSADAVGLAKIALSKFSQHSQSAINLIESLTTCTPATAPNPKQDPYSAAAPAPTQDPYSNPDLINCESRFQDTVDVAQVLSEGLEQKYYESVTSTLVYLRATTDNCDDELSESKCLAYSPLVKMNNVWETLLGICLGIVQTLSGGN